MIPGMDFGTTNSGMAVYDGRQVKLLPLDPENANPNVARTSLYITNDQTIFIGREAVNRYFSDNVGRPVKLKKVWVGEVEVYGADMFYVTDVYAWVDVLSPGRLFLSIKTGLRDADYKGTVVGQFYYSLENLVSTYLSMAKLRAERLLGKELRQVVLGRPVHFADDPKADALAQTRLLDAAFRAGYEKVYLQYEPIAAAYHYSVQMERPQNILVFDFGGGTLDITVMRLDGHKAREVLATGGVPIAGDVFDRKLVRAKLPTHFGEGSYYFSNGSWLPLPKWIFDVFSDWQTIMDLQTPKTRKLLNEIARTADRQRAVEGLVSLVTNNYGLQMFDVIEQVKRRLSDEMATMIRFSGPKFKVSEMVTRSEFEQLIYAETQRIEKHLDQTVRESGLRPDQIDAVIRTGGSSNIPVFKYMLMEKFGAKKVQAIDTFSSVTSGLGVYAHGIEAGEIEAKSYTADDLPKRKGKTKDQSVASVNLGLLQRRMQAREDEGADGQREEQRVLLLLTEGNRLLAAKVDKEMFSAETAVPLPFQIREHEKRVLAAQIASLDEPLLLATSFFRFLLTTPGHLLDLQEMGMTAAEFYHFKADEYVST
ncbi:MAG: Hsp70 family protein, partial [Candidatus Promineifilaceae bacterium]